MLYTSQHVTNLLDNLKALLDQITPLRHEIMRLEADMAQVRRDYEQRLGTLNNDFAQLKARERYLRLSLAAKSPSQDAAESNEALTDPALSQIDASDPEAELEIPDVSLPAEDPRMSRKRALADHIEYFISDSDREVVMHTINAVLADEERDMGDMLELLAWGDIWSASAPWETVDDQYTRLESWREELKGRVIYWRDALQRLQSDDLYHLWEKWHTSSDEEWSGYLEELAQQQIENNDKLAHAVSILEEQWQIKQTASEDKNDA